ncbi:MAG: hypothetical protein LBH92_04960 [Bacteroidales bacterium]|jgi:putative pyruvate formate lyase activating enzyme|nr:hypothetical protein [Bacteroidales bacterium]
MNLSLTLENCRICPRQCGVNRFDEKAGFCRSGNLPIISSICIHKGEEPVISGKKGICNLFFAHCNLRCIYCQNYQISRNENDNAGIVCSIEKATEQIIAILDQGIDILGFVSPSHFVVQMIDIIDLLHDRGYFPTIVYNSNGYDSVDTLSQISDYIDVYLPDLKYCNNSLGKRYSNVNNYMEVSQNAVKEMYRQKGSALKIDENGLIRNGMIIRHLALPEATDDSKKVMQFIADIDSQIYISLMAQYYPPFQMEFQELNRKVNPDEYEKLLDFIDVLGLENGWIQDLKSSDVYKPDFERENPFN